MELPAKTSQEDLQIVANTIQYYANADRATNKNSKLPLNLNILLQWNPFNFNLVYSKLRLIAKCSEILNNLCMT